MDNVGGSLWLVYITYIHTTYIQVYTHAMYKLILILCMYDYVTIPSISAVLLILGNTLCIGQSFSGEMSECLIPVCLCFVYYISLCL